MTGFLYRFAKKTGSMPRSMLYAALCCLLLSCSAGDRKNGAAVSMQLPKDSSQFTSISWLDSTTRDFGTISEGQKLVVEYRFKNTGEKPLIIARVQPSCGCTVAEQPEKPVLPGLEGVIKASFNSEGRIGINHKKIYVTANTLGNQVNDLNFSVTVQKKKW